MLQLMTTIKKKHKNNQCIRQFPGRNSAVIRNLRAATASTQVTQQIWLLAIHTIYDYEMERRHTTYTLAQRRFHFNWRYSRTEQTTWTHIRSMCIRRHVSIITASAALSFARVCVCAGVRVCVHVSECACAVYYMALTLSSTYTLRMGRRMSIAATAPRQRQIRFNGLAVCVWMICVVTYTQYA